MANGELKVLQEISEAMRVLRGDLDGIGMSIVEISKNARSAKGNFEWNSPKKVNEEIQKSAQYTEQVNAATKEQERLEKALIRQIAKKDAVLESTNKALIKQRYETQQLNKANKEEAILTSKNSTFYQKQNVILNQLTRRRQDLLLKQKLNIKLTDQEEKELKGLTKAQVNLKNAMRQTNEANGRFTDSVGKYQNAFKGLRGVVTSLVGAFGLTNGIYLFVNGIRDAFNRVREFDKSMQNLAGVFRTTREDLSQLEEKIISVAGETVRTSNEVAELANTLATLGKSPAQIENLLKPVIDLSLGLNAAADEAGEFLVQMLNAFGESDEKAEEFADTIATIRTSTTLDFQKMRDSFQYIAPISRLLGKDLAYTGSVVGILADNSLKAEQAGRLLSTAQIKLATQGKTLDDALQEINQKYEEGAESLEILALSEELFGKQASKVGAILALNTDAIELNAQAIRDNGGALKDLTDRQLESLDAKLKILDSSYEKFILTLESGDGPVQKFLISRVEDATKIFSNLSFALGDVGTRTERLSTLTDGFRKIFSFMSPVGYATRNMFDSYAESVLNVNRATSDSVKDIESQNAAFIKLNGSLAPLTQKQQELIDKQKEIKILFGTSLLSPNADEEVRNINLINKEINEQQELLRSTDKANKSLIESIKAKIEILEAERDAILGVNKSTKEQNKAIEGSIAAFEQQIAKLKEVRDTTALTNEEYEKFNNQIEALEFQISELDGTYNDWLDSLQKPIDISFEDAIAPSKKPESIFAPYIDLDEEELLENELFVLEKRKELDEQLLDQKRNFYNSLKDLAFSSIQSIFEAESVKYQERIDENNRYYDALLNNEELTEKQRSAIEAERDAKNRELEQKQRETDRKAFLFGQAAALAEVVIETAKSVAAIKAQAAVLAANPITAPLAAQALAQIPFVIGTGAAAGAAIVATTLPQFKDGLFTDYEGKGKINDEKGSRYKELVVRKSGQLEMFNQRNKVIDIKKGDRVLTATMTQDILRNSAAMSMAAQQERLEQAALSQTNIVNVQIEKQIEKAMTRALKNSPPPISNFKGATAREIANELYKTQRANRA